VISRRQLLADSWKRVMRHRNEAQTQQHMRATIQQMQTGDLSDADFQLYTVVLLDVLLQSNAHLWEEVRRLQWLSPGLDVYRDEEGDV
jgi:hypothetical protein